MSASGALGHGASSTLHPPRLLDSAGFRFAVLFAAMFAVAAVAMFAVMWWATAIALDRQTDAAIRADAIALTERWREAGPPGLVEAIQDRLAVDTEKQSIYLLREAPEAGGQARRLVGNLDRWPQGTPPDGAWFRTRVTHDSNTSQARLHRLDLPGVQLIVGRDEDQRVELRRLLTEGVIYASGAVVTFALAGAWLMRRALQRRLGPVFETSIAIAGGDLAHRVPRSGRDDEFDRLARTLNAMLDRIGTLMEGVRGVSDAIAHDLRTPIARARAKLEEALTAAPPARSQEGAALRAAVEQGIADLDNISRIFQALLRIAEAEAGARRAAFAPFDMVPVLQDVAEFYAVLAEARGQSLDTALPDHLPVVGDRDLLVQAVANLLDNAIKFTPQGGAIQLSARQDEAGSAIIVADNGPGMPAEERAHAGERFFRADKARATPGSGLGLSLVQAMAHLHGGELMLDDADPGKDPPGLQAVLHLPRA